MAKSPPIVPKIVLFRDELEDFMSKKVLSKHDVYVDHDRARRSPQRELAFYGSIREGFESAIAGLQQVEDTCRLLANHNTGNVRLESFCSNIEKLYENIHKLRSKASRIKINTEGAG